MIIVKEPDYVPAWKMKCKICGCEFVANYREAIKEQGIASFRCPECGEIGKAYDGAKLSKEAYEQAVAEGEELKMKQWEKINPEGMRIYREVMRQSGQSRGGAQR